MRELGAQSLRLISAHDLADLAPVAIDRLVDIISPAYYNLSGIFQVYLLKSLDTTDIHGALSALSEIAIAYKVAIKIPSELEGRLRDVGQSTTL